MRGSGRGGEQDAGAANRADDAGLQAQEDAYVAVPHTALYESGSDDCPDMPQICLQRLGNGTATVTRGGRKRADTGRW